MLRSVQSVGDEVCSRRLVGCRVVGSKGVICDWSFKVSKGFYDFICCPCGVEVACLLEGTSNIIRSCLK